MAMISKDALLSALERKYGDLTDTRGCRISTDTGSAWISVSEIVALINSLEGSSAKK